MTRTELYDAVRAITNRPNLSDTVLGYLLSMLEGELNRLLLRHPRNEAVYEWTADNTSQISVPAAMGAMISLVDSEGQVYEQYPPDAGPGMDDNDTPGYISRGTYLEIHPATTAASGYTYYLRYYAFLTGLSSGGASNWVSIYFPDVYLYGLLKQVGIFTKDAENTPLWAKMFGTVSMDVSRQGWDQNVAMSPRSRRVTRSFYDV